MLFACIYVPDFPVEAIVRAEPELREQPVAVLDSTPPLLTVIAANARAREAGIDPGMTKLQAEACPGVHLRRRSMVQEEAARAALLDCAHAFSPRVEDTNRLCPAQGKNVKPGDTVTLDIAGLERLFGAPATIARDLASGAAKIGLKANVAVACNPDTAMLAARGFSGLTVIAPGTEGWRLGTLSVGLLEPPPEILETLECWGIRDFCGLALLPEIALSQRLGQEGLRLQRLAQGRAERMLVPVQPATKFEEAIELEHPVELLEPLAFVLNRLLERICDRLASRVLATHELQLTLELAAQEDEVEPIQKKRVHQRHFQFPVPIEDSRTLLKLLQLDLAAHSPGAPVEKIMLVVEPAPSRFVQAGLFLPRGPEPERLELVLARLRGIAGDERVGSAELLDTHAPGAFRMRPFHPHANGNNKEDSPHIRRTAMRIFRPPLEAKVQMKDGVPAGMFLRGIAHRVLAAAGPWRNNGGWWSERAWTRDEWDLELKYTPVARDCSTLLVRAYRDLSSHKWYVEGSYD